jgi:hypothetical protein
MFLPAAPVCAAAKPIDRKQTRAVASMSIRDCLVPDLSPPSPKRGISGSSDHEAA